MSNKSLAKGIVHFLVQNETHSALSPKVRHLICHVGVGGVAPTVHVSYSENDNIGLIGATTSQLQPHRPEPAVCCSDGFIEFSQCADILPENTEPSLEEYYVRSVAAIAGTFNHSQVILDCLTSQEFTKTYGQYLLWTKHSEVFLECFELLTHKDGADDHLSLLLLCAGLERALGNLFLLRGLQCPKMLKDLLAAKELEDILGCTAIKVLQVVIGPPVSLNIRNVSWHGFLSEAELPRRYIYFLLLVTASLGKVLEERGIFPGDIITREYIPLDIADEIIQSLGVSVSSAAEVLSLEEFVVNSWLIGRGNINFFKSAMINYRHQRFGQCVVQLLPLLEHALRNIFVVVNNCPGRLVTAEATTLYTTFEEILAVSLADGTENRMAQVLGEPCMDLLHDLLVYPSGPRVRDRLGHGEVDYQCVPEGAARILLVVFTHLAGLSGDSMQTPGTDMLDCLSHYQSAFHPVMLLHQKILRLCSLSAHLHDDLETSPELTPWNMSAGYDMFLIKNSTFARMQGVFTNFLNNVARSLDTLSATELLNVQHRLLVPFCCVHLEVRSLLPVKVKTLYKWQKDLSAGGSSKNDSADTDKSTSSHDKGKDSCSANVKVGENEIVGILSRIISETARTLTQTKTALQLRQEQLASKQLRSRQRDNMKKLLFFLPCASLLANYVTVLSTWQFCHLGDYQNLDSAALKATQRFLKNTLQTCENLRTLTSGEVNKWSEAGEASVSEVKAGFKFTQLNIFS